MAEYLARHPDFLKKHPELLSTLSLPAKNLGGNVADFQHFQLKNLQENAAAMKQRYNGLVEFCRDNLSVQSQAHEAALRLIRARSLEQLLEALTVDAAMLLEADVVRLAVEADTPFNAEMQDASLTLLAPGTLSERFSPEKKALLLHDAQHAPLSFVEEIFAGGTELARSCALLRMEAENGATLGWLALGSRHAGRFQPGQGTEALMFLAQVTAARWEHFLGDLLV